MAKYSVQLNAGKLRIPFAATILLAFSSAFVSAQPAPTTAPALHESKILIDQLKKLLSRPGLADALAKTHLAPTSQPSGPAASIDQIVDQVRSAAPEVFEASDQDDKNYQSGQWNDQATRKDLDRIIDTMKDFKTSMPPVSMELVKLYQAGKLAGGDLQMAYRILNVHLHELIVAVTGDTSEHPKPICI